MSSSLWTDKTSILLRDLAVPRKAKFNITGGKKMKKFAVVLMLIGVLTLFGTVAQAGFVNPVENPGAEPFNCDFASTTNQHDLTCFRLHFRVKMEAFLIALAVLSYKLGWG